MNGSAENEAHGAESSLRVPLLPGPAIQTRTAARIAPATVAWHLRGCFPILPHDVLAPRYWPRRFSPSSTVTRGL